MINRRNFRRAERGQVLILCAIFMVILLLFVGLAIDFGMAYVTRAQLGKAADAAALTAARYSAQGTTAATNLANSAFAMNYNSSSLGYDSKATPTVVVTPTPSTSGTLWSVTASANNQTFFAKLLPQFSTLSVASSATTLARTVEMTLVLDISSSMTSDGGSANLPSAVQDFITYFDDKTDSVALVYFSTFATTAMKMTTGFQSTVISDSKSLPWGGHTFSDDALQQAFTQEMQPVKGNVQKVVVFFTDGGANTIQNTVNCTSGSVHSGNYNFGGEDPTASMPVLPANDYDFMNPTTGAAICNYPSNCCNGTFPSASVAGSQAPAWSSSGPAVTPWTGGTPVTITHNNVRADALYRAVGDAIAMRKQVPPITVYAIGLGSAPDAVDPQFLCQVANDATCSSTYDPNLPAGVMQYAATAADLAPAFETIASIIRLRLTQ